MVDITKCSDEECPMKETCYRYTAKANEYRQSYFIHKEWKEYTRNELVNLSEACYEKYNG